MKHARVNVSLIDAWEEWLVEVPEDADEDWIIENLEDISAGKGGEFLSLLDSGNYGFEDAEVMKIDDAPDCGDPGPDCEEHNGTCD